MKRIPVLLLLLIVFPYFLQGQKAGEITVEDIFREFIFYPESVNSFRSMNNGQTYSVLEQYRNITEYDYLTGKPVSVIFSADATVATPVFDYEFSKDEKFILLVTGRENIYRRSFRADYLIYDRTTGETKPVSKQGKQMFAMFSPDGRYVSFVRDNNIYLTELSTMQEKQLTTDGKINAVINGAPDWVYEEEFALTKTCVWSPDAARLAYYRFDETRVRDFTLTKYGKLYPELYTYKYPKAGEENSVATIHVYDIASGQTIKMDAGTETDQYIGRIFWTRDPGVLSMVRVNRLQNKLDILHADASSGKSEVVFTEENPKYIEEPADDMLTYLPDGKSFLCISERSGWRHLYLYDFTTRIIKPVTTGEFDISGILGYDERSGRVFYSSHELSVTGQDVFSIMTDGTMKTRLSTETGWNEATFSSSYNYYINDHSTANKPDVFTLHSADGKPIRVLESHTEVSRNMKSHHFSNIEFITVPAGDIRLNGFMIKPPGFNAKKKYPLFIKVYGGPESQEAIDRFQYENIWLQMIAQKGYVVAVVDGRGTDSRGEEFRKSTYMELGKLETLDQVNSARYLSALPFIDKTRIGIYGWSYGGFVSLLCIEKGAGIFKMAISVAPITNWRFYDTIYSERFMRKPQENPSGYDKNSPVSHVKDIKGKLLLVHGMFDDNVHLQNSVSLVQELIRAGITYEMLFYPNRNHNISGDNASVHIYSAMTDFILENL